ncbi:MAG: DNA glycosylase [Eubacteriales bacterium]|nr:DNA glycosylase [Eubacteriales bacterium]
MDISYENNSMIIRGIAHFSLSECLACGQAFRWRQEGGGFFGVALGCAVYAEQQGDTLTLRGVDERAGAVFIRYFDLERDYGAIKEAYAHDPFLCAGMAFAQGLRVLNQPPFETLISFIISANNNVGRISRIIGTLCERYGERIGDGYDFPEAEALASLQECDLVACGAGYRAGYIVDTASMVADGFDLLGLAGMPYLKARYTLTMLPGVGPKVADCVALYSLGFTEAFPADVWMKRVLCEAYGYTGKNDNQLRAFVDGRFGAHAGLAQQYLFHYARNNKHIFTNR